MRVPSFLVFLAAFGCAPASAPVPTVAPSPSAALPEGYSVSLHLDSAQAFEVLATMEKIGEPVLVDALALASLKCAGVTVSTSAHVSARVAAETVAQALRSQGYRVEYEAGRWIVSVNLEAPPKACAPPASAPVVEESLERVADEVARSICRVSETEYVVTRHGEDLLVEHLPALIEHVRTVPELQANKVVGIRLSGLREGDTLERLGLMNGDRVERLEGHDLSDPQHALEAYTAVRNASRMVLEIERRGAPVRIVYRVE